MTLNSYRLILYIPPYVFPFFYLLYITLGGSGVMIERLYILTEYIGVTHWTIFQLELLLGPFFLCRSILELLIGDTHWTIFLLVRLTILLVPPFISSFFISSSFKSCSKLFDNSLIFFL